MTIDSDNSPREVVNVVGDLKHASLDAPVQPEMYVSLGQCTFTVRLRAVSIVLRAAGNPLGVVGAARAEVRGLDKDQPVDRIATMERLIERSTGERRFSTLLLGTFALLALVLASLGIYGVMSFMVSQRTQEIGIRLALGAGRRQILSMVFGQGLRLTGAGLAFGFGGCLLLTQLLGHLLFGVKPSDPVVLAAVALLWTTVAGAAVYIPARRAMKVDPMVALRNE